MATSAAVRAVAPAVADLTRGQPASRLRSLLVAGVVGASAAVLTYRLLRSAPAPQDADDSE
jgi:hypothetical protein